MSEKKYELRMPTGCLLRHPSSAVAHVTLADLDAIEAQCEAIREKAKQREWRFGDVMVSLPDHKHIAMRDTDGRWRSTDPYGDFEDDDAANRTLERKLGVVTLNLPDLLASGPIVVGLTEDEADFSGVSNIRSCKSKLYAALTSYRAQKGESNGK